ncbi:unnamed protein product [Hydatigera taeniaeformis]|uniref:Dymeclin n=1 Tax=Hydatigena taeniaeformis TaxID=6205 RepID=A0A0R3X711_HYDTA|nr:unnamed protein product [Hydatigera taeniaeformis]
MKQNGSRGKDPEKGLGGERDVMPPRIPFGRLCETLASTVNTDSSVLLLYLLLHRNDLFRTFVMETRAYEKFTFSICSLLYQSPAENSHLVYMALIVLLILTENENFAKDVHEIPVKKPPPNADRQLTGVSLGSLLVHVLTRTIRHHLNQLRDKYLHINSLAALANLSPKITYLHSYVSQALVDLLQKLVKRHKRLVNEIRTLNEQLKEHEKTARSTVPPYPNVRLNLMSSSDTLLQDISLLEEVIRMTLEIFNSILTHSLAANTHLIYNLLYQREYLAPIHNHPSFNVSLVCGGKCNKATDLMQNIDTVLGFFASRIEKDLGPQPTETSAVMAVINKSMGDFTRIHTLKEFQELKFKYVEEDSPDEFFIPYVWSLVYRHSGLGFEQKLLHSFGSYEYCASENDADGDIATATTASETTVGIDLTDEEDLDSVSLQFQKKRFYVDVKRNWRGRFMKIAEVGLDGRKSRILLTMTAADDLKDKILDLADVYTELMKNNAEESGDSPAHVPKVDGVIKSHTLNYPHRRYYLDLKKNAWGYFLRVTMLSTNARIKLAIPADGMRELYNSIYGLLKTWWIPAPDKTKKEVNLPPSRAFRIDSRTLYFDSVANRHGIFLRISQVWATSRSAITIPGKSIERFREIINELADHISAATIEHKEDCSSNELQSSENDKTDSSNILEASALETTFPE